MLELWFSVPIKKEKINYEKDKLVTLANEIYSTTDAITEWNCDTYSTIGIYDAINTKEPYILDLIKTSENEVVKFAKLFTTNDKFFIKTIDFWFNISKPGSYQEFHNHPDSHFSAIIYLQAAKDSGNTIFKSYESYMNMHPLPVSKPNTTRYVYDMCTYEPEENTIIIFKSNLQHKVSKNLSNSNRISIAMNFAMTTD